MAAADRPRVFLDTNVLVSALYSAGGPPGAILRLHVDERITIVVSQLVMDELIRAIRLHLNRLESEQFYALKVTKKRLNRKAAAEQAAALPARSHWGVRLLWQIKPPLGYSEQAKKSGL